MSEEQRLLETKTQLDAALNRLEVAVAARLQSGNQASADDAEMQRLTSELAAAKARHDGLRIQADTVSARLDGTINRLKSILEN